MSNLCSIRRTLLWVAVVEPSEPEVRHVWVRGHGEYGPPQPGLVLQWQPAPVRNATSSAWSALVLTAPFLEAVLVQWVSADRLIPIRDATPADGR